MAPKRQPKPKAKAAEPELLNNVVEISDEILFSHAAILQTLTEDGRIPIASLLGQQFGAAKVDERMLRRLDKDRTGFTLPEAVLIYCYPNVSQARFQDFFAKELHVDSFLLIRQAFSELAVKGKLTASVLSEAASIVGGHFLPPDSFTRLAKTTLGIADVIRAIFPHLPAALVDQYTTPRITVDQYFEVKDYFNTLDVEGSGSVGLQQLMHTPSFAFHIDLETLHKAEVAQISFPYLLRVVYPSLSDRIIRVYTEMYTPELATEFRTQRSALEDEEHLDRETLLAEEQKRWGKIEQALASLTGTALSEYGGVGDPPGTAESNTSIEEITVSDAMRQRRERDAKDRAAIEAIEDGDRWNLLVEEHRQRLRFGELLMQSKRQVLAAQRAQAHFVAGTVQGQALNPSSA